MKVGVPQHVMIYAPLSFKNLHLRLYAHKASRIILTQDDCMITKTEAWDTGGCAEKREMPHGQNLGLRQCSRLPCKHVRLPAL